MPSLRESQDIKKDASGNRNAERLPIKMGNAVWRFGFRLYFLQQKRTSFDSLFSTEMEGFEPSRHVNDLYP